MKHRKSLLFVLFTICLLSIMGCKKDIHCIKQPDPDCVCTMQYDPVCGCNNKTYGNACMAECEGVKYTKGECK